MNDIFDGWLNGLSIQGRATRKEYWLLQLSGIFVFLFSGLMTLIYMQSYTLHELADNTYEIHLFSHSITIGQAFVMSIIFLPIFSFLIVSVTSAIRRMHDTGRNGFYIFFPIVNLVLLFVKGDDFDNKYGKNPY